MPRVFIARLAEAIAAKGSPVCVGLDPVLDRLPQAVRDASGMPAAAIEAFSLGVLEAVAPAAPAVKIQSACFERYGSAGFAAMETVATRARELGLIVIYDAKRGDIGISARHYAEAAKNLGADAITASPYLGPETIEPYLETGLGVFVLVRTSNPGSAPVQTPALMDGRGVAHHIARIVSRLGQDHRDDTLGLSGVGAVVGATQSSEGAALRAVMPDQVFLIPGFGAQGGTADDIRAMLRPDRTGAADAGVLVTASRSIIYPNPDSGVEPKKQVQNETAGGWQQAIADAAERMRDEIAAAVTPERV
ncbi:MAG: orotidine-5'-phosphate decarboxylase [Planctomycetota bacterium]